MTDYLDFTTDVGNSEVADTFDDLSYWSSMFGQLLFRHVRLSPCPAVLDIGCGTGFPLLELADRLGPSCAVHGIDSWDHAVSRARRKARVRGNKNVHVTHGDAAKMPYDDNSFELIVSNLGVNNFDAPAAVLAECRRVCRPGGRVALTTNLAGHMHEFYEIFERTLVQTGNSDRVDALRQHQAHRATREGLYELFSAGGLDVTEWHTERFTLRYADGSALMRAYLSRVGFLDGWRSALRGSSQEAAVFEALEARLNQHARDAGGELRLTIPAAYIEGRKRP